MKTFWVVWNFAFLLWALFWMGFDIATREYGWAIFQGGCALVLASCLVYWVRQ